MVQKLWLYPPSKKNCPPCRPWLLPDQEGGEPPVRAARGRGHPLRLPHPLHLLQPLPRGQQEILFRPRKSSQRLYVRWVTRLMVASITRNYRAIISFSWFFSSVQKVASYLMKLASAAFDCHWTDQWLHSKLPGSTPPHWWVIRID